MVRMFLILLEMVILSQNQVFGAVSYHSQLEYLVKYGYLEQNDIDGPLEPRSGSESVKKAVLGVQAFAGLEQTGDLDWATRQMMEIPRCGMKDINTGDVLDKWEKQDLTFRILNYPTNSRLSRKDVDRTVDKAFSMWQKNTNLKFRRKHYGNVDIEISFEKKEHGDKKPFDGQGGTLAHAFFPKYGGNIHIDDSENWTLDEYNGKNLLVTVLHELGHSFGLEHSSALGAVMAGLYRGWDPFLRLGQDDIKAMASRYGKKKRKE